MNLQTARTQPHDVTRAARVGASIGESTANQMLSFSKLAQSAQKMREDVKLENRALDLKEREQNFSFRERAQQMEQSADLHPLAIEQAQQSIQNQLLAGLRTEQNIRQQEIEFPLRVAGLETEQKERESRAELAAMNLKDRQDAAAQSSDLNGYMRLLATFNSMSFQRNADPTKLPKPPATLTGKSLAAAWDAYDGSVEVSQNNRLETARSKAEFAEQEEIANLVKSGHLSSFDVNNPQKVFGARFTASTDKFNSILGSYQNPPAAHSTEYTRLLQKYRRANGILDEVGLRRELSAKEAKTMGLAQMTVDEEGNARRTYSPTNPGKSIQDRNKAIGERAEQIIKASGEDPPVWEDALAQARIELYGSPPEVHQMPKLYTGAIQDLVNVVWSISREGKDVEEMTAPGGQKYIKDDHVDFDWFTGDYTAGDMEERYTTKLREGGVNLHPFFGKPRNPTPGEVYWDYRHGKGGTLVKLWTYDFTDPSKPRLHPLFDKVLKTKTGSSIHTEDE